jgi:hypothetical protein
VHQKRNVLSRIPRVAAEMVAATILTIFAQPDEPLVREQLLWPLRPGGSRLDLGKRGT